MKNFLLLTLTAGLLSPISANAEQIPGISNFKLTTFDQPKRLLFNCPRKIVSTVENGRRETESVPIYPECWVEVHKDYLNVMDRQIIKRSDVVRFWKEIGGIDLDTGKCCSSTWNFSYKDKNKNLKRFKFIRKINIMNAQLSFGYEDKKVLPEIYYSSKKGRTNGNEIPDNVFNAWMSQ